MADVKHTQWAVFGTPQDPDFACEITSANGEIAAVYEHPNAEARGRLIAATVGALILAALIVLALLWCIGFFLTEWLIEAVTT